MTDTNSLIAEAAPALGFFEARLLLSLAAGRRVEHIVAHPEAEVSPEAEERFRSFAERRSRGEPYPYIAGVQEFYGRPFRVTTDVLIPRPDTEILVEAALDVLRGRRGAKVLDMGTGSGCIAVTLSLERPDLAVYASDVSEAALDVARGNGKGTDVTFFKSRWFGSLPRGAAPFDAIVSNPPYVADDSPFLSALSFEPAGALVSGSDGMNDLREIIALAPGFLRSGGCLAVEHGFDQGEVCRRLFEEAGFANVRTLRDLGGDERVTQGWLTRA